MFGGSKPFGSTSSTFGSTGSSLFGQTNKPAGSSLFGASPQQQQQSSSLFGQKPATSSIFGSTAPAQSSSLFGSSSTPAGGSSLFGSQNKPSLFGSSTPASTFGSPAAGSTSMFGSTSATSGGLFGSGGSTTTGTAVKFDPVIASDTMMKNGVSQNISTKHMCITAMKAYENKSLEELRVEDYIANRKAPQAGSTGGLFGSTSTANTSGGLFGSTASQPKNIFGSSGATSSPFGTTTTGTTGSSLFGGGQQQQQQQTSSLFGAKPATGGLFGSPAASSSFGTAPTQSSSLFGNTTQTATFGQPATGTSLFGGTPAPTFGATATSQPSSGFSFGGSTSATPAFGATAAGGGLFGSTTQQSGSLFGAKPATGGGFSFGSQPAAGTATSTGGGLFGSSTAAKPLFGSTTTTGTSLFGSQPAQQAGGLFGSTQPQQQSSLFGSQPAQTFTTSMPSQVAVAAAAPIILGSDVNQRQVERALIEAQLSATPYGDGPLLKWMGKSMEDTEENPNPTSVQRQVKFLASKVNSPGLSVNGSLLHPSMSKPGSTPSSPALSKSQMRSPVVIKDLAYSSSSRPPTLGMGLRSSSIVSSGNTSFKKLNSSHAGNSIDTAVEGALSATGNRLQSPSRRQSIKFLDPAVLKEGNTSMSRQLHDPDALPARAHAQTALNSSGIQVPISQANFASPSDQPAAAAIERERNLRQNQPPKLNLDVTADESMIDTVPRTVVPTATQPSPATTASPRGNVTFNVETRGSPQVRSPARQSVTSPAGVTLADAEYFSEPSIAAMAEAVKDGWVELPEGLRIGRATYGSVYWPGPVRVKDLVIDQVVVFRHKEVTVYPDESSKPAEGEGLNRPAEVTLERVWPIDKQTKEEIKDPALLVQTGFRERLQRVTARMGAVFKDYRPATGSWVFRVEHFSKYGLPDDDDSEGECMMECEGDRPPSGFAQGDVHNLVQKEKINLKPLFADHHNHQVSDDDVMNYNGEETVLSVRMTPTNIKSLGGLGGGLMHAHAHEALLDQILEEEIPEKRIKLHDDVQGMLTQCQKLFDRIDTGVTCKKLQLQTVESRPETSITRPYAKSLMSGCSGPVDEAAQKGAVCPVRFSRDFFFTVCKQPGNSAVELVKTQYPEDIDPEYLEDMLEHNVRYSQRITRSQNASASVKVNHVDVNSEGEDYAAWIKPTSDFSQLVNSFAETATQCERPREGFVWELCRALFPVEKAQLQETPWIRRRAVAGWLKSCLPDFVPKQQKISDTWKTVCSAQLNKLPVDGSRLFNLCALLPICTEQIVKDGIQGQLDFWEKNGLLDMLSEEELNIYLTIVGKSAYSFKKTDGTNKTVNVVEGLHWMQILSLYVWFSAGSRDSLEDCVMRLKEDMRELRTPIPERDLFWELIQLAVDGDHAVEKVLDAAVNFCVDPLDYHVSWHLWSVLRSHGFAANASSEQRLMTLYAEQLFASERIHLSAFVLSHIEDTQCRSAALRDLLMRIAPEACVDDYKRILGVVDLPMKWIASARAVKAHLQGRADSEFELMLEAGDLPTAERILATDLGPNNIAASDFEELLYFVELIEAHLKSSGQKICMPNSTLMYIDYVKLRSGSVESDDELLELCDLIEARIERLDFTTPVQRMQRAIISRHLKEVRRSIGGAQSESFMPANVSSQPAVTVAHLAAGDQDMTIVFDD